MMEAGTTFGIFGTVLLLLTSFSATDAVHTSLSVMLMRKRQKRIRRSLSFHVVFVIALIVLTAAAIVVPPLWEGLFYLTKGMSSQVNFAFRSLLQLIADVVLVGILLLGSVLSYRYLSPGKVRLRNAFAGTVIFLALLQGHPVRHHLLRQEIQQVESTLRFLVSIICFILVTYFFAAAYLYGASVIGFWSVRAGRGPSGDGGRRTGCVDWRRLTSGRTRYGCSSRNAAGSGPSPSRGGGRSSGWGAP